jgi:hypothetical protein
MAGRCVPHGVPLEPADGGGMVVGWMTKIALAIALIGVIGFDSIALAQGHLQADDAAGQAADQAATVWSATHNYQQALIAARGIAAQDDMLIAQRDFVVHPDGSVTVTIHTRIHTTVLQYVPGIKKLSVVTVSETRRNTGS